MRSELFTLINFQIGWPAKTERKKRFPVIRAHKRKVTRYPWNTSSIGGNLALAGANAPEPLASEGLRGSSLTRLNWVSDLSPLPEDINQADALACCKRAPRMFM
jgi:hypothetical protein